jgi:lipopolysaccharide transport system permease protein
VVYASSRVKGRLGLLFGLNPLVGVIDGFRWALLGRSSLDPALLGLSLGVGAALFLGGAIAFARVERTFADEL